MAKIMEGVAKSAKSRDTDSFLDRRVFEPVANCLSLVFARLGVVPNAITVSSGIVGVAGGVFFFFDSLALNAIGMLMEIFAYLLDTCDGQVARMTGRFSKLGRILDGLCDGLCYVSIYVFLSLRLMSQMIPFAARRWGWIIWPLAVVAGLSHQSQSAMVDYYKNLHIFLLKRGNGGEFDKSEDLSASISLSKPFSLQSLYLRFYRSYTRRQEKSTPKLQRLLARVDFNALSDRQWEDCVAQSRRILPLVRFLAYHPRAIILYALTLIGQCAFFFPAVIIFFGAIELAAISNYERAAARYSRECFGEK